MTRGNAAEAEGIICHTGEHRHGRPVFVLTVLGKELSRRLPEDLSGIRIMPD